MKTYTCRGLAALFCVFLTIFGLPDAFAQTPDEPQPTPSEQQGEPEPEVQEAQSDLDAAALAAGLEPPARWGLGIRARGIFVPKAMLEWWWEEVSGSVFQPGFGLDVVRIKEDFELRMGLEWDPISTRDGYWLERGDDALSAGEEPDFTEFKNFGWITADATFIFHWTLAEFFAIRYGAGLGIGVLLGKIDSTDAVCTSRNIQQDCMPRVNALPEEKNVPPVFPVVNLLAGVQFRPHEDITINIEAGLRTLPFFGLSAAWLFF